MRYRSANFQDGFVFKTRQRTAGLGEVKLLGRHTPRHGAAHILEHSVIELGVRHAAWLTIVYGGRGMMSEGGRWMDGGWRKEEGGVGCREEFCGRSRMGRAYRVGGPVGEETSMGNKMPDNP
jgi:hypothetical protein